MKLKTLIEYQHRLELAEVEIALIPGVPQVHFLGLPDQTIKESFYRIKSAFKSAGFKFPIAHQVIVNIKPSYLKKTSKGLELAVALGILELTGQSKLKIELPEFIIYGELGLDGSVTEPRDLAKYLRLHPNDILLTGTSELHHKAGVLYRVNNLNEDSLVSIENNLDNQNKIRPQKGLDQFYSEDESEILFLMSVTGFHTLLAGGTGAGKSTLAKNFVSFTESSKLSFDEDWKPVIMPHHSVTTAAFLGGGAQLYQGEVERVQDGILILDEFLEFNSEVVESLRGPMVGEKLRLVRAGAYREIDCQFQIVATTNLCPCGKKTLSKDMVSCRFSAKKCQGYLERLSGPILDRFGLFYVTKGSKIKRTISGKQILKRIESFEHRNVAVSEDLLSQLYPDIPFRRLSFLKEIAKVYAAEEGGGGVGIRHLTRAERWTYLSFKELDYT